MGKYEEALERAKQGLPIDEVFPELKESEDERIKEEIIQFFKDASNSKTRVITSATFAKWAKFLEKQKEQKPHYTYEQSKQAAEDCYYDKDYNTEDGGRCNEQSFLWGFEEGVDWCEQQKQNFAEWSEEDESKLSTLLGMLTVMRKLNSNDIIVGIYSKKDREKRFNEIETWLKSLRPQPHWKPSEEQINALKIVARGFPANDPDAIDSLLTDLQKLL